MKPITSKGGRGLVRVVVGLGLLLWMAAPGSAAKSSGNQSKSFKHAPQTARLAAIQRAQVWAPTDVPMMNLRVGPQGHDAFAPDQMVACDYVPETLSGSSPKFDCKLGPGDVVKVRYGSQNGEVEGEVLTTRLLWALGFGADRMYPVRVTCRGCTADPWTHREKVKESHVFDAAVIERKAEGHAIESGRTKGWAWPELEMVDVKQGGAPVEQRDALKLLAVMVQHTDSKPEQQRLVCLSHKVSDGVCKQPFMLLNDVGQTFGHANAFNRDVTGSVSFELWVATPIWKDPAGCVGRLTRSNTGTLENPVISEAGRAFLAGLLLQLTDGQLHDLFEVAHVDRRSRKPGSTEAPASVDEWVSAFKHKRDEIVNRRCDSTPQPARRPA